MKILASSLSASRPRRSMSIIEMSIVLPLFFFSLFGMIDFSYYLFAKQTVSQAVREGGRIATTGRILFTNEFEFTNGPWITNAYAGGTNIQVADPGHPSRPMSREQAILFVMSKNLATLQAIRNDFGGKITNAANTGLYFSIVSWPGTNSATEASPNPGPGERTDDDTTQYVKIAISYPSPVMTPVSTFAKFFGGSPLLSSNKLLVEYQCTFINESWAYNNTNRWTN
ncbi:MAG: TadE family protein [Verrucomicrobiota bacterium]